MVFQPQIEGEIRRRPGAGLELPRARARRFCDPREQRDLLQCDAQSSVLTGR